MAVHYSPYLSKEGLVLRLDAGNIKSYPGTGTSWYDLSGNNNHFTVNSSAFNSSGPKYMDFNGSYGCAVTSSGSDIPLSGTVTAIVWTRIKNSTSDWRTLFRGETSNNDHQVIIQAGGWNIGMYDNVNGTGLNSTGYSQQSLPGYGTTTWNMLVWRWTSVSNSYYTYEFSYNDTTSTTRGYISSTNARFKGGPRTIGAYNASTPSQFWGDISHLSLFNRRVDDTELLRFYTASKGRFGL